MKAGFTPDDQDKLANTLLMLIEDLVTELHTDKTLSFVLSLDIAHSMTISAWTA